MNALLKKWLFKKSKLSFFQFVGMCPTYFKCKDSFFFSFLQDFEYSHLPVHYIQHIMSNVYATEKDI